MTQNNNHSHNNNDINAPIGHKPNIEGNKIFAAALTALCLGYAGWFVSTLLVAPQHLEKSAIEIDTSALESASAGGAAAAPAGPEPILALLATADVAKGEKLAKACAACHGFDKGGINKVGPNMWGIVNNKKGHAAGFAYSDALLATAEKSPTWNYQSLNVFLWKPQAYASGTKMNFIGLKKPEDRAAVIAWLRTLADSPAALPSEAEIAAEAPKEEEAAKEDAVKEVEKAGKEQSKPDVVVNGSSASVVAQ